MGLGVEHRVHERVRAIGGHQNLSHPQPQVVTFPVNYLPDRKR